MTREPSMNTTTTSNSSDYTLTYSTTGVPVAKGDIVKLDEDQQLVFGWASVISDEAGNTLLDRQQDFIDSADELEKSAYDYVLHSRDGGEMHVRKGVSTMVESMVFTAEKQQALGIAPGTMPVGWWIGFKVNDPEVWAQVKKADGYVGFSVHGTGKREAMEIDPNRFRTDVTKRERGIDFPAAAFAYHGDLDKPSTWRLRVWEDLEKKTTARQVANAIARLDRSPLRKSTTARVNLNTAWGQVHPETPCPVPMTEPMSPFQRQALVIRARTALALVKAQAL